MQKKEQDREHTGGTPMPPKKEEGSRNMTGDAAPPLPILPARTPKGHKGTFGTVAVIGGCARGESLMLGGPCISAVAALRVGAGLVRLVMPHPILAEGLTVAPSATGVALPTTDDGSIDTPGAVGVIDKLCEQADCVAVGPGFGHDAATEALTLRLIGQTRTPIVVDADAINALAAIPELTREFRAHAVLTPHPGEYRRLASALRIELDPTDESQRPEAAQAMAQRLGCVVVLKGAGTVVSDGLGVWVNDEPPNPAMGTAGTGDALTGVIAGLIGQFHRPQDGLSLFDCARIGVRVHSMAARAWVDAVGAGGGMLAMELCDRLPGAVQALRGV